MTSLARVRPLAAVLSRPVSDRVADALARVDEVEHRVHALVFEDERRRRTELALRQIDGSLPLAGVPVGIKDTIAVDGLATRAGSELPAEVFAMPQASIVTTLLAVGCVVLGKTQTTGLAFADPAPTVNPHDPNRTPGGSSSGSAAAVAAGYVPVALGTQTVDSIITPAAYCGVVGYKPSFGKLPLDGAVPFAPSMDHVGVLGADVASVAAIAAVLDREWSQTGPPESVRLGVSRGPLVESVEPEAGAAFEAQLASLKDAGAHLVDTVPVSEPEQIREDHYRLIAGEFAAHQRPLFEKYEDRYRPLISELILKGLRVSAADMNRARQSASRLRDSLMAIVDMLGLDALVCPSATGPAPVGLDFIGNPAMSIPWTNAGLPCVSVPAASGPAPLGVQLVGRFGSDDRLLALAGWVERALGQAPGGR